MFRYHHIMLLTVCTLAFSCAADMSPDDVMLRKPVRTPMPVLSPSEVKAANDDVERRFAEAKAKAEAEAQAKAAAQAEKEKVEKAREQAEAENAKSAEELKRLREQVAAEKEARERAEQSAAAEKAKAEAAVQAADAAKAAKQQAETAKVEAEAAMTEAVQKVRDERLAREQAEAGKTAAEARAAADRAAAEKAVQEKAAAEQKVAYLKNPDPDEKPQSKAKLQPPVEEGKDVTETVPGVEPSAKASKKAKTAAEKKTRTGREAVITADRTDYDRKEGVILFDRNVCVDDEQYQMHADRLFVFLDGTNDLKRLVAIGNVAITNEEKTASCSRAVYTKATSKIVMYGDDAAFAKLHDSSKKGGTVEGRKITFWLNSEEMQVEESAVRMPTGSLKAGSPKDFFNKAK